MSDDPTDLAPSSERVTRWLKLRLWEAQYALARAPRVPRWPVTDYSRWYYGWRSRALRGYRDPRPGGEPDDRQRVLPEDVR